MANEAIRIPREAVESSNIAGIGYDNKRLILAVEFKSGAIFHFAPFTLEQAAELYGAPSKGRYFAQTIKGKIPGQKMTGPCPNCGDKEGWIGDPCADCGTAVYVDGGRQNRRSTDGRE